MSGAIQRILLILTSLLLISSAVHAQDYSGWWWNSEEPGTGYSLEVQDVPGKSYDVAYMVWYLYTEDGLNTWYSSIMKVTGDTMTGDLVEYDGWPLEAGIVSDTVVGQTIGPVTMTFSDTNNGVITYTVDSVQYQRTIERWEQEGAEDSRDLLGWWWDTDKQGVGWFIESRNGRFFLGWYNYREQPARTGGMPRWYITVDFDFPEDSVNYSQSLLDYSDGQTLTGAWQDPTSVVENDQENFELTIPAGATPTSFDLAYEGNSFHLTRFTIPDIFTDEDGLFLRDYYPLHEDTYTYTTNFTDKYVLTTAVGISGPVYYQDVKINGNSAGGFYMNYTENEKLVIYGRVLTGEGSSILDTPIVLPEYVSMGQEYTYNTTTTYYTSSGEVYGTGTDEITFIFSGPTQTSVVAGNFTTYTMDVADTWTQGSDQGASSYIYSLAENVGPVKIYADIEDTVEITVELITY